jgi:hypothetical protein
MRAQSWRCSMISNTSSKPFSRCKKKHSSRGIHTVELDFPVKVRVVEDLHRYLVPAIVQHLHLGVFDGDVLFNALARQLDLFVFPSAVHAVYGPVCDGNGETGEYEQEEVGLEPAEVEEREKGLENVGNDEDACSKMKVVERAVALCETDEGGIFDCWVGCHPYRGGRHAVRCNKLECFFIQVLVCFCLLWWGSSDRSLMGDRDSRLRASRSLVVVSHVAADFPGLLQLSFITIPLTMALYNSLQSCYLLVSVYSVPFGRITRLSLLLL